MRRRVGSTDQTRESKMMDHLLEGGEAARETQYIVRGGEYGE